ncbi:hypothetical protein BAZ12_19335 [Elizabethkingia miricola]|uniref:hypothetical protein n=1 Tax=Elizabethkingia miricola TaxID=172045 RepID=UPI0009997234|nr:hypothetical protein [Elizabethkingia miricola]OPC76164.1 hypothetical protein BAZ12_19335 [Elizabethkingia miricola]
MNPNELRIGNLLEYNGRVCIVTSIDSTSYFKLSPKGIFSCEFVEEPKHYLSRSDIENYEPILLTEEWLLKFGFIEYNKHEFWCSNKELYFAIINYSTPDEIRFRIVFDEKLISTKIKYVHQLQNLFFVLTAEELTLHTS